MKKILHKLSNRMLAAIILLVVFAVCAVMFTVTAVKNAGIPPAQARNAVAYVQQLLYDANGNLVVGGSGTCWGIGKPGEPVEYFVTNGHVVQYAYVMPKQDASYTGQISVVYSGAENDFVSAQVVYYSAPEEKDIAILKVPRPTDKRTSLPLRPSDTVEAGEQAYALGFPGVSDTLAENIRYDVEDVTITDGIISKRVSMAGTNYEAFQINVDVNPGNSGGPLVDGKGNVIGVNTSGLVANIADQVQLATSVNYASIADQLIRILNEEGIEYTLMGEYNWMLYTFGALGVVALAAAIVLLVQEKRAPALAGGAGRGRAAAKSGPMSRKPVIRGVTGKYNGQSFDLSRGKVVIGRDPAVFNIVYDKNTPGISSNHCQVVYDANSDCFMLTDNGSTYGTFLGNGKTLTALVAERLTAGDTFYLCDNANRFVVTKE